MLGLLQVRNKDMPYENARIAHAYAVDQCKLESLQQMAGDKERAYHARGAADYAIGGTVCVPSGLNHSTPQPQGPIDLNYV